MNALIAIGILYLAVGGCATWQAPEAVDDKALRARALTETAQDVRLSAAVLSAEDSWQMLGADVNAAQIQPVWVEVENASADTLWLPRAGTDPDYFSPLEVAWSFHTPLAGERNAAIDAHFDALDFPILIPPGATRSGIIFTNPHRRTRLFNVDLLGPHRLVPFTLFLPVPDDPPDQEALQIVTRYVEAQRENVEDTGEFRVALERSACCAAKEQRGATGDPLNVVLVGEFADIGAALVRRGFRSERMAVDDDQRLFGRPPDVVLRKAGQGGVPANWVRGWVAPFRYRGQPVFLGQVGRPVGGRLAVADGKDLVVHPGVDEARNLLIQDLMYSGGLAKLGFVGGAGAVDIGQTPNDVAPTSYRTDGLRAVLFFVTRPLALSDIQLLDWVPYLQRREAGAAAQHTKTRQ